MREEVLRMSEVTYSDRSGVQLQDFCLNIFEGEIVGLILRRGHGVTALTELLHGNLPLQAGYIYYREELVNSWRAPRVHENRIAVITGKSCLVDGLTVADNIFVLRPGFRTWLIRPKLLVRQLQPVLDDLGAGIAADAYVDTLSSFQRVVVELVKASLMGCRLVILREIGAIISDMEMARLREILRHYADTGMAFLYIGFHYEEMEQICDRIAAFSDGRITKVLCPGAGSLLYEEGYTRRVREQMTRTEQQEGASPALELRDLCGGSVRHLSFTAAAGECVVLQDLQNQIFGDLIALLLGDLRAESGEILLAGRPFVPGPSREIAILRERPDVTMIFPELTYLDNLCITADHRLPEVWRSRSVRKGIRREWAQRVGEEVFFLHPNQYSKRQRYELVIQRILLQRPQVVFCVQPFNGADVGMRMHIWEMLDELKKNGIALVILAVNLADTLTLATRLVRVRQGAACEVYEQRDFEHLPFSAPWIDLYRKP